MQRETLCSCFVGDLRTTQFSPTGAGCSGTSRSTGDNNASNGARALLSAIEACCFTEVAWDKTFQRKACRKRSQHQYLNHLLSRTTSASKWLSKSALYTEISEPASQSTIHVSSRPVSRANHEKRHHHDRPVDLGSIADRMDLWSRNDAATWLQPRQLLRRHVMRQPTVGSLHNCQARLG